MKKAVILGVSAVFLVVGLQASANDSNGFDDKVTIGAIAGTTGYGADVEWRFHEYYGLSASYTGGLNWDGDYDSDDVKYHGDLDIAATAVKFEYYPFGGSFFLTAGAMLPDMDARVDGKAQDSGDFEINGNTYSSQDVGSLQGKVTIADSVQPYVGLGWRSSYESGLGFYGELGVMSTDVKVDLGSSNNYEATNEQFREDLERERKDLEDDADELSVYPVAVIGITYSF